MYKQSRKRTHLKHYYHS